MREFGIRDKMGYFFGDFGACAFYILTTTFLTVFYMDVLGISGYVVGTILFVTRIFNAFTDVTMGRLVDTLRPPKDGKCRGWVRRMAIPYVAAVILLFLPVAGLPMGAKIVYAQVTYMFYVAMGSAFGIPYGAMASRMTADPAQQGMLSTFRNVGSSLSSAIANVMIPALCFVTVVTAGGETVQKTNGTRFFGVVVFLCVCALVSFFLCYSMCTERIGVNDGEKGSEKAGTAKGGKAPAKNGGIRQTLRGVAKNRPFLVLSGVAIILLLSQQIVGSINAFVYKDYFKKSELLAVAGLLMTVCTFTLAPFMGTVIRRFGKKEAVVAATFTSGFFYMLLGFLHTDNVWCYLALSLCATFGAAFFNTIVWALVMDVTNYQKLVTGEREEASIYSMYSFCRKIGQALAGGLGAATLSMIGYVSSTGDDVVQQSAGTIAGMYNIATFVPGVAYLLIAVVMLAAYPLTKEKVLEMAKQM